MHNGENVLFMKQRNWPTMSSEHSGSLSESSHHSSKSSRNQNEDGSSHSNSLSGSSTTGTSVTGPRAGQMDNVLLAQKELKAVAYARVLVIIVLVISAAVAGVITWIFSTREETNAFQNQVC